MSADRIPDVHQAMEAEARERLAAYIPVEEQDRLGIVIALGTGGDAAAAVVGYANDHAIDLAVLHVGEGGSQLAHTVLDNARCAVLVLR